MEHIILWLVYSRFLFSFVVSRVVSALNTTFDCVNVWYKRDLLQLKISLIKLRINSV